MDEWNKMEWQAAEAKLNTNEYIQRIALNKKIVQMNMPDITRTLNVMKSVANNLNQLAKMAHKTGATLTPRNLIKFEMNIVRYALCYQNHIPSQQVL